MPIYYLITTTGNGVESHANNDTFVSLFNDNKN